jgi:hypothetical protein
VLARFLLHCGGGFAVGIVAEDNIGAGFREKLYRGRANTARSARDECRLACQRNHISSKFIAFGEAIEALRKQGTMEHPPPNGRTSLVAL